MHQVENDTAATSQCGTAVLERACLIGSKSLYLPTVLLHSVQRNGLKRETRLTGGSRSGSESSGAVDGFAGVGEPSFKRRRYESADCSGGDGVRRFVPELRVLWAFPALFQRHRRRMRGGSCHTFQAGIITVTPKANLQVSVAVPGVTANLAGELVDSTGAEWQFSIRQAPIRWRH